MDDRFTNNDCISFYMTYIIIIDAYESHPKNEKKTSSTLLTNVRVLHYTHDNNLLLIKVYLYIYVNGYIWMWVF